MLSNKRMSKSLHLFRFSLVFFAATLIASPARAAFHLWNLQELYSNSSGTLQFIELFTTSGSQTNFRTSRAITVTPTGGSAITFNTPTTIGPFGNGTLTSTLNRSLLYGTAGLQAAGGPVPDVIIPDNFLPIGGGNITFFGANSGGFTALPTDSIRSRAWTTTPGIFHSGNNTINSPTNFAGTTSPVPEPTSMILVPLAMGSLYCMSRRRRSKSIARST